MSTVPKQSGQKFNQELPLQIKLALQDATKIQEKYEGLRSQNNNLKSRNYNLDSQNDNLWNQYTALVEEKAKLHFRNDEVQIKKGKLYLCAAKPREAESGWGEPDMPCTAFLLAPQFHDAKMEFIHFYLGFPVFNLQTRVLVRQVFVLAVQVIALALQVIDFGVQVNIFFLDLSSILQCQLDLASQPQLPLVLRLFEDGANNR